MNIKKMFTALSAMVVACAMLLPNASVFAATYSQELQDAYNWAYSKGVTTMSPIDNANMYGAITRSEMAKMLSVYATEVLGMTPDTSAACTFSDIDSVKGDLHDYIIESCQLGIMGQGISAFRPYDTISRAEFGTALSRVLWGSQYEGGTPYYAKHLDALKAAGIMTQIANAESTKEIRGYVMLMLMRSEGSTPSICEDTDVKVICAVEAAAEEYKDCPVACRAEANEEPVEDVVVKSGDLAVTATAAQGRKILIGGISDLDTLTFRSSEKVTLNKVILERYGYSQNADVLNVWLEDADGNMITEKKQLDSKGQAKLSIKKDYRNVDGSYTATIVVEANGTGGNTMWFKVVDVESSAKNLNVDNYTPYTYDMVAYAWATVTLSTRVAATPTDYNFEAGKSYEIAKFKVEAPADSAVVVRGFTLDNTYTPANVKVDVERYLEDVVVKVDGKEIKAKYSVDRDAKVTVSFDGVEVAAKKKAEFTVSESFSEDFDSYDKYVRYTLNASDFNATDVKTESRVKLNVNTLDLSVYHFLGGKVKLSNVKLGNKDASYGAENVKIAEWSVTTSEALRGTFAIYASDSTLFSGSDGYSAIANMKVIVAWEDYDGSRFYSYETFTDNACATTPTWGATTWEAVLENGTMKIVENNINTGFLNKHFVVTASPKANCYTISGTDINFVGSVSIKEGFRFSNVDIEESGKIEVRIDLEDNADFNGRKIKFSSINSDAFSSLVYEDTRRLDVNEVAGYVKLSDLTIQPSKAALKNNLTKAVEFLSGDNATKVVFDWTYSAKNGTVKLTDWTVKWSDPTASVKVAKFYLTVDGEEINSINIKTGAVSNGLTNTINDVTVEEGESVKILVEAEIEATSAPQDLGTFQIIFAGEDENGNNAGSAKANTIALKTVAQGSVTLGNDAARNTALRKAAGVEIAQFTVKPSNGASDVDLDTIKFVLTGSSAFSGFDEYDVTLTINDESQDLTLGATGADYATYTTSRFKTLPSDGVAVKVVIEPEVEGKVVLTGLELNGTNQKKSFSKYLVPSLVSFESLSDAGAASYEYKLSVDGDASDAITGYVVYTSTGNCVTAFSWSTAWIYSTTPLANVADGDPVSIKRVDAVQEICGVEYYVEGTKVSIGKLDYPDYFKIGGKSIDIPKA